jgi:hypothetical protein
MCGQHLSRNWAVDRVQEALEVGATKKAELIEFLGERYMERFLDPIKALETKSDENRRSAATEGVDDTWRYGFSIVSLCCLLIETFASYRRGLPSSDRGELETFRKRSKTLDDRYKLRETDFPRDVGEVYRCFFESQQRFFTPISGGQFYTSIRNGLLHQAQTKHGWTITRTGSLWDDKELTLDRTKLMIKLNEYFKSYLEELKNEDWESQTWRMARRRLFWLCELSKQDWA